MNTNHHEQLATGFGAGTATGDATRVRINPIGEGDVTLGASGERTHWPREVLREAVDNGVLDGATIVKGTGGENPHFPLDEQVPPENIVGRVEDWEYQAGVGPVGEADLVDEQMAAQIDAGLLEVSADLFRELGEHNADVDATDVDTVLGMPRITVLEKGASASASIDTATAEALGLHPSEYGEYLQSAGDAVRWESENGGPREPSDVRYGVVVNDLPDGDDDEVMVASYQPDEDYESWEPRGEQNPMQAETLDVVGPDGVESLPAISQVVDTEQNTEASSVDEGPDSSEGSQSQTQQPDSKMTDEDTELHEQLAEVRQRADSLEEDNEQLAEEKSELEDQLSELEDDLEERDETIEQLQPIKTVLAEAAAGDSHLNAEQLADRFEASELIDSLADDENDDQSPVDVVREQLAADIEPRGDGTDDDSEPVDDEEVEQLSRRAMNIGDLEQTSAEDISNRQYIKREYDVDPAEYGTSDALRDAMRNGGDA